MLIVITRSDDGAVNVTSQYWDKPFIRINVDKPTQWGFKYVDGFWTIFQGSAVHHIGPESRCWWWKPYFDNSEGDPFTNAEISYFTREIYAECGRKGQTVGNAVWFHSEYGKLHLLDVARRYFPVPKTIAVVNQVVEPHKEWVIKALASEPFANGKVLFTTKANLGDLNPIGNPWFTQEYVSAPVDVTVVIVGKQLFAYRRNRTAGQTVDWRKEQAQDADGSAWHSEELSTLDVQAIENFLSDISVSWGRIDFLRDPSGVLWFLEFNANGQFGFLESVQENGLVKSVARYLQIGR